MTTLGKIIGGGMPVGAYGGRKRDYGFCITKLAQYIREGTLLWKSKLRWRQE